MTMRPLVFLCALVLACAGCRVKAPAVSLEGRVHPVEDISASTQQARLRIRALALPLSGAIVEAADRISAATTDPGIRRGALIWKLEGVPALREALFRPNPFFATMDAWVLAFQMSEYYDSGGGKLALGDAAPIAVTTCQYLQEQIAMAAASLTRSGNVSDAGKFARDFAMSHPITLSVASRESILSLATERQIQDVFSVQEAAGTMIVTLDDLSRRMDVYSVQLLDQARWQAELLAMDMSDDLQADEAIPLAKSALKSAGEAMVMARDLVPEVQDTLAVARSAPDLIARERAAALRAMSEEISRVIQFVQEERIVALERLSREREAVMTDMQKTILDERKALLAEAYRMGSDSVDHAFHRVAQLFGVGLVAFLGGVAMLLLLARRLFVVERARMPQG